MSKQQALKYKQLGNKEFNDKNYPEAIKYYSQAIEAFPLQSIFFSNRARAYLSAGQFQQCYADAKKAIEIDQKNIKGYYLMGQALLQQGKKSLNPQKITDSIQKLKKSLTLCPSQGKQQFQQNLVHKINLAKKQLWLLKREVDRQKQKALRSYLTNLVQTDNSFTDDEKDEIEKKILSLLQENLNAQKARIPQPLICPITKMLMKDPVCNEYGNSYSKKAYSEEINKKKVDPILQTPLKTNLLYPNLNIKKAIQHFVQKHPWAYQQIQQ